MARTFQPGAHAPLITPFKKDGSVDLKAVQRQVLRIAKAGMGVVLMGTNGEACHLSSEERVQIIKASREVLDANDLKDAALLVGTGGQSARETIQLTKEAAEAGADFSIVIAPGYFAFVMGKDTQAVHDFFVEVADNSPIPIMVYNFPGAASGIDLSSDALIALSEHQNIFGTKLTCAGIGKGHRVSRHVHTKEYQARHPTKFVVVPGFADYTLPALIARADGMITGTGNVIPKTMVLLYNLAVKAIASGNPQDFDEALKIQDIVSDADWCIVKAGISGTKYALDKFYPADESKGETPLGGFVRNPLPQVSEATKKMVDEGLKAAVEFENSLP